MTMLRVLVVDDEPEIRRYVEQALRLAIPNVSVTTASSGEAALETLGRQSFDVVLCDQRMGSMDGVTLLQHVARRAPDTRRIIMSGFTDFELLHQAVNRAHVDRYLAKPFSPDELVAVVQLSATG